MIESLRSKVISGLFWSVVQSWGTKLFTLLLFMVLARVLGPHELGVFAAAMVVLAFVGIFVDQGLSEAIVQRAQITVQQLNTVFLINFVLALLIVVLLWFIAPLIAGYLKIAELTAILRVASFGVLVSATCFSQQAMNKRNFRYRWLAICALVSTLVGGAVAVFFALRGLGVWSMVIQGLSTSVVSALMLWIKSQWRFSFDFDFTGVRGLFSYGLNRLASSVLDFANTRYIEIFLAAALGPVALGLYSVGVRVYQALMQALSASILDVALNGFSRLVPDRLALVAAYYQAITLTAAVAVPVFCLLAVIAPEATIVLFGNKWADSADIMRPMALLGAVQVLQFYNVTILNAIGKPSVGLKLMVLKVVTTFLTLWIVREQSLSTIVYAFIASQLVTTLPGFYLLRRFVGVSLRTVVSRIVPFLLGSLFVIAAVESARTFDTLMQLLPLVRMLLLSLLGVVIYAVCVYVLARSSLSELMAVLRVRGQRI